MIFYEKNISGRDKELEEYTRQIVAGSLLNESVRGLIEVLFRHYCEKNFEPFSIILLDGMAEKIETILREEKRSTDILVKIDGMENRYALVCLETKVEGGFFFAQRLMRRFKTAFVEDIYMVVADIRDDDYDAMEILCTISDMMEETKKKKKKGEVILHSFR